MLFVIALTILYLFSPIRCDIIRHGQNSFFGGFTRTYENQKMRDENVLNKYSQKSVRECARECLQDDRCAAFQRRQDSHECETLNSSLSAVRYLLRPEDGWTVYDTDPAYPYNGKYCLAAKPCPSTHICHDTFDLKSPYQCRCERGFGGSKCERFIGPGSRKEIPAGSCRLLKMKYKRILSEYYWLKKYGNDEPAKKVFCNYLADKAVGCIFQTGDGIGVNSTEVRHLDNLKEHECIAACLERKRTDPDINGVARSNFLPVQCWCERKMTRHNTDARFRACMFSLQTM